MPKLHMATFINRRNMPYCLLLASLNVIVHVQLPCAGAVPFTPSASSLSDSSTSRPGSSANVAAAAAAPAAAPAPGAGKEILATKAQIKVSQNDPPPAPVCPTSTPTRPKHHSNCCVSHGAEHTKVGIWAITAAAQPMTCVPKGAAAAAAGLCRDTFCKGPLPCYSSLVPRTMSCRSRRITSVELQPNSAKLLKLPRPLQYLNSSVFYTLHCLPHYRQLQHVSCRAGCPDYLC